ncbi:hypothetical protein BB934_22550 [Microvirga ossetica]|uniref:Uncharacterized protein n=1 Tax=Microvirga ossetica TaxID=1882682 RepID=A0A1B2EL14_9HYPH|nr:hypothetical protein BB934_22550 [Microvirga ossetica]
MSVASVDVLDMSKCQCPDTRLLSTGEPDIQTDIRCTIVESEAVNALPSIHEVVGSVTPLRKFEELLAIATISSISTSSERDACPFPKPFPAIVEIVARTKVDAPPDKA